jgi:chorismate mutase/prephenate dehydratase
MFFTSNLKICGEVIIDINHCLLSNSKISEIKKLYCHPQAFAQCEGWISKNLPNVEIIEVSSTARAAEIAAKEKYSAAIASELAAMEYNLKILARNIQDEVINKTRFLIIGKIIPEKAKYNKTSILFTVKHVPGALFRALKAFNDYKINMTKIESRPIKGKLWEYAFFVDFQGHIEDRKVKTALKELKENCIELKILGSYPEER